MTTTVHRVLVLFVAGLIPAVAITGCDFDKSKEGEEAKVDEMSVLALPVSLRAGSPQPGNAHAVELAPNYVTVNGQRVLEFEGGEFPASEVSGNMAPKLKAALSSPAKSAVALEVHSNAPFANLFRVLGSAQAAGIRNAAFKVRKPGGTAETGWMALNGFKVMADTEEEVKFDTVAPRPWNDFVAAWDQVFFGCSSGRRTTCVEKTVKVAKGGNVQITLFSAGDGVNLKFERMGGPSIEELTKALEAIPAEERAEVLKGMPPDVIAGYMKLPFAQSAGFQFRSREAVIVDSPVTRTMAPVCGKSACAALMKGRRVTLSVRVLQLIGAAFPDGTPAPTLAFMVTEK